MNTRPILVAFCILIFFADAIAQTRIMPMGDSITEGFHPQHAIYGGYRQFLENLIVADGLDFNFVGSRNYGSQTVDRDHEAYGGIKTLELRDRILADDLVANANPDVILLKIGTNDILSDGAEGYSYIRSSLIGPLLDTIEAQSGSASIFVSQIMPFGANLTDSEIRNSLVNGFNQALTDEVATRQAQGKSYFLVSGSGWTASLISVDAIHPSDSGYSFLASKFKQALDANALILPRLNRRDFNRDGYPDLLYRSYSSGQAVIHYLRRREFLAGGSITAMLPPVWKIAGTGDMDGNGYPDLVYRNSNTNIVSCHYLAARNFLSLADSATVVGSSWSLVSLADFNRDGQLDFVYRNNVSGQAVIHYMNGMNFVAGGAITAVVNPSWDLVDAADFNRDGYTDLLYREVVTGRVVIHYLYGRHFRAGGFVTAIVPPSWDLASVGDFDRNGYPDIVYRNVADGRVVIHYLKSREFLAGGLVTTTVSNSWELVE